MNKEILAAFNEVRYWHPRTDTLLVTYNQRWIFLVDGDSIPAFNKNVSLGPLEYMMQALSAAKCKLPAVFYYPNIQEKEVSKIASDTYTYVPEQTLRAGKNGYRLVGDVYFNYAIDNGIPRFNGRIGTVAEHKAKVARSGSWKVYEHGDDYWKVKIVLSSVKEKGSRFTRLTFIIPKE